MSQSEYSIAQFPPAASLQTVPVLTTLVEASTLVAELRGRAASLPNPDILLNTLFLQEALASSEIENIVTTLAEAFRSRVANGNGNESKEAKEVSRYCDAMHLGYGEWKQKRHISSDMLIKMFQILKQSNEGYRNEPVVIANSATGEVVYRPPRYGSEVASLMQHLEQSINDESPGDAHALIKMALIHHQFESIHPFTDGNGRVGRVLNVLYLTHRGLLDSPILYLSRPINSSKSEYYRLLQAVREEAAWEEWVLYILRAVVIAARTTLYLVTEIKTQMEEYKQSMRNGLRKIYSHELINNLFSHPYTTIEYVARDLEVERRTARRYLQQLAEHSLVEEMKHGRHKHYVNRRLMNLLSSVSE